MTVYTTYFDANFMSRGLACLDSLVRHSSQPVRLLVLALDARTAETLPRIWLTLGHAVSLEILTIADMIARYPALSAAQGDRVSVEFYFTLTPFLCAEAVARVSEAETAIYLDADLYFFADPAIAERAADGASVAIVEHRFPASLAHLADSYGRFNVGWIAFRNDRQARSCLASWQAQCLVSCADKPEQGRFGDQKYLDAWPQNVTNLAIVACGGVNLAPWNVERHALEVGKDGQVFVDGAPLVFYHFHRLRRIGATVYETDFGNFGHITLLLRTQVYKPYLHALDIFDGKLRQQFGWSSETVLHRFEGQEDRGIKGWILSLLHVARLFTRRRVVFRNGHALSPLQGLRHG